MISYGWVCAGGRGGGGGGEGYGCGSAVQKTSCLHATVTSAFDMWRPWVHLFSPLTTQLLIQT